MVFIDATIGMFFSLLSLGFGICFGPLRTPVVLSLSLEADVVLLLPRWLQETAVLDVVSQAITALEESWGF